MAPTARVLSALVACFVAAAGSAQELVLVAESFDAGIPADWTTVDAACPDTNWFGTVGGYQGNSLDGTEFAFIDSDAAGQFCAVEDYLVSPAFDASGSGALRLTFDHYFRFWVTGQATVQVYDGAAWVDVATWTSSIGAWSAPDRPDIDLSPYANAAMQVRFRYTGNWDWYWAVDNVKVHEPLPPPAVYCTAKVDSQGCAPAAGFAGVPSATGAGAFDLTAAQVQNNRNGILFYGVGGPDNLPFQGGTLCVKPPLRRTPVQNSGGNPPPADCSGTFAFDFNAWTQGGIDPNLAPGVRVDAQFWYRDPAGAIPAGLSDAVDFTIGS